MTLCYRCGWRTTPPHRDLHRFPMYGRRVLLCGPCCDWMTDTLAEEEECNDDD